MSKVTQLTLTLTIYCAKTILHASCLCSIHTGFGVSCRGLLSPGNSLSLEVEGGEGMCLGKIL